MTVAELRHELKGCMDYDIVEVHIASAHGCGLDDTFNRVLDVNRCWDKRGCVFEIGKHRDEDDYLL